MAENDEIILNGVLDQFAQLCRFPHPSWGEKPLADYIEELLCRRGLSPIRDQWNNLMADIPASPGRENAPLVVVQGHLDMVCAVKPGSDYDPAASPVVPVVKKGMLRSDGNSSLGADNNLGNATVLWIMDQEIPHGPVRLLFTVAEEVGLQGAKRVDPAWLEGARYLINTDGFYLGRGIISSAGGLREKFSRAIETVPQQKKLLYALTMHGFPGGHSGYDIHFDRPNPISMGAQWLRFLGEQMDYELVTLSGGHAENAIPMDFDALIAVDETDVPRLEELGQDLAWQVYLPDGEISVKRVEIEEKPVWTKQCRDEVLRALGEFYDGVSVWHNWERDEVGASANLGVVRQEGEWVKVSCFIRAAKQEEEDKLVQQHKEAAWAGGFQGEYDSYPGWPIAQDDYLMAAVSKVWWTMTGKMMNLQAVHVGLEPSVLGAKNPDMLMISIGPTIYDPHSLDERAPLEDIPGYAWLLMGVLDELSEPTF